jgi:hypothetical protein
MLARITEKCNEEPLPPISERLGVRLPEEKFCLTATNYEVLPDANQ